MICTVIQMWFSNFPKKKDISTLFTHGKAIVHYMHIILHV